MDDGSGISIAMIGNPFGQHPHVFKRDQGRLRPDRKSLAVFQLSVHDPYAVNLQVSLHRRENLVRHEGTGSVDGRGLVLVYQHVDERIVHLGGMGGVALPLQQCETFQSHESRAWDNKSKPGLSEFACCKKLLIIARRMERQGFNGHL